VFQEGQFLALYSTRLTVFIIASVVCIIAATDISAQGLAAAPHAPDPAEGKIIDSIVIKNENIFQPAGGPLIRTIYGIANALHWVTREEVIRSELLFEPGDAYSADIVRETARNIRTRLAITEAIIYTRPSDSEGHVIVVVETKDEWSLILRAEINSDGDETDYRIGLEERNLFGYNHFVSVDYYWQERDENYFRWRFSNPRLRGLPIQAVLDYSNDPVNELRSVTLGRPFYNLGQSFSLMGNVARRGGRRDLFVNSDSGAVLGAQWQDESDVAGLQSTYRWGSYHQKTTVGLTYQYVYENILDTITWDDQVSSDVFPEDSLYHEFGVSAGMFNRDFIVERGIDAFYYSEDITLQQLVEISAARAFNAEFDDHYYNRFSLQAIYSKKWGRHLFDLRYDRSFWYKSNRNIRMTSGFTATVANNGLSFMTTKLRARYLTDWRDDPIESLVLGGRSGLRGYDTEFSVGDRLMVFNLEMRFFSRLEILSVLFGGVAFVDIGRTWKVDEPFRFRDFNQSLGTGLRISFERYSRGLIFRVDAAYAQNDEWRLVVGSGQYF
jgi:hypothetical protein